MCRCILVTLAAVAAAFAVFFQIYARPLLAVGGRGRPIGDIGNSKCTRDKSLKACAKLVLHQPSGLLYLACSPAPHFRSLWLPSGGRFNKTGGARDYLSVYDPEKRAATRLALVGFRPDVDPSTYETGLTSLGLDVVTSVEDENEIFVYAVNERTPPGTAWLYGADPSVEVFKGTVGGKKLRWIQTITDPLLGVPNDIVGSPDGKSFYVTNDHKSKGIVARGKDIILERAGTNVVYCHLDYGCKIAAEGLKSANGIARGKNGEIYVGSTFVSQISVMDRQADDSLVVADVIKINKGALDRISVDEDGTLYVAEYPRVFHSLYKHLDDPNNIRAPSAVLRVSLNDEESSFYGEKYKVERIFEDNGTVASGMTTAAWDSKRNRLYLHGLAAPTFLQCAL